MRKILIGILLGLSLGISFSLFAWVNPSQNPPSGGGVLQTSNTGLTINTSTYFISGNVGIGTTGPEAKLDVRGDIILPRENIIKLGIPSVGGYGEQIRNSYGIDSNYGIAFIAGGSERMRITNTGNVGIGTTAPTGKLDVGGGQLVVTSAGNVGIGTTTPITSPGGGLHVFRSGTDAVIRVERDAGVILNIEAGTIGGAVIKTLSNHPLNLGSNSVSEILTIATSGKVGIGTTNPNEKLYVAGGNIGLDVVDGGGIKIGTQARFGVDNTNQATIRVGTGGLRILNNAQNSVLATIQDGTYSNALFINYSGNVGIGTTNPAQKLNILVNQTSDYFTLSGCSISANSNVVTCSGGVSNVIPGMFLSIYQASNSYPSGYTPVNRFIVGVNTSLNQLTLDFAVPRSYDSNTFTFQVFKGGALVQNYPSGHTYNMALSGQSIYLSYAGSLAPIYSSIGAVNGTFRIVSQKSVHIFLDAENTFSDSSGEVKFSIGKNSSYFGPTYSEIFYVNESGAVWAASYTCPCDLRLKKDIKPLNSVLDKVLKLNPVYFTWNEKSPYAGKKDIGIIAQEIKKYFPEIVSTDDRGYLGVDYSKLSVVAISAIKEQQKIIEEQAQKIKILEEKIKELELKIEKR